jgi:hypothetical protein
MGPQMPYHAAMKLLSVFALSTVYFDIFEVLRAELASDPRAQEY